jgi:hypothetical protein
MNTDFRYWGYLDRPDYFARFLFLSLIGLIGSIGESEDALDRMLEGIPV